MNAFGKMKWEDANKTQVARAKEDLDENPAHFGECECSSSQETKCCVEA